MILGCIFFKEGWGRAYNHFIFSFSLFNWNGLVRWIVSWLRLLKPSSGSIRFTFKEVEFSRVFGKVISAKAYLLKRLGGSLGRSLQNLTSLIYCYDLLMQKRFLALIL